jgi:hypothetical protein
LDAAAAVQCRLGGTWSARQASLTIPAGWGNRAVPPTAAAASQTAHCRQGTSRSGAAGGGFPASGRRGRALCSRHGMGGACSKRVHAKLAWACVEGEQCRAAACRCLQAVTGPPAAAHAQRRDVVACLRQVGVASAAWGTSRWYHLLKRSKCAARNKLPVRQQPTP